jgi:hypothetical protein
VASAPLDRMVGVNKPLDYDFPIKILDNIIQVEEQMYGFSLYNRGTDLKKSLIDPKKVKDFISKYKNTEGDGNKQYLADVLKDDMLIVEESKSDNTNKNVPTKDGDNWKNIMSYLKENP